jgi:hypothetical protein
MIRFKPSTPSGAPADGLLLGKTGETTTASLRPARRRPGRGLSWAATVISQSGCVGAQAAPVRDQPLGQVHAVGLDGQGQRRIRPDQQHQAAPSGDRAQPRPAPPRPSRRTPGTPRPRRPAGARRPASGSGHPLGIGEEQQVGQRSFRAPAMGEARRRSRQGFQFVTSFQGFPMSEALASIRPASPPPWPPADRPTRSPWWRCPSCSPGTISRPVLDAGQRVFGENRVQEAMGAGASAARSNCA